MSELNAPSERSLSWSQRLVVIASAVSCLGLLAVAATVDPDPRGLGTHQQLGLPPCTIQAWSGIRCPSCGMTTAWAHFVRGQWWEAGRCSLGGVLLAFSCSAAIPWLLLSAWQGRWVGSRIADGVVLVAGSTILLVTLADWLWRLLMP